MHGFFLVVVHRLKHETQVSGSQGMWNKMSNYISWKHNNDTRKEKVMDETPKVQTKDLQVSLKAKSFYRDGTIQVCFENKPTEKG